MHFNVLCEIDATEFFEEDALAVDLAFCKWHATFIHREACEFVFHIGSDGVDGDHAKATIAAMEEWKCSSDFIMAYRKAAERGATRVMFYA